MSLVLLPVSYLTISSVACALDAPARSSRNWLVLRSMLPVLPTAPVRLATSMVAVATLPRLDAYCMVKSNVEPVTVTLPAPMPVMPSMAVVISASVASTAIASLVLPLMVTAHVPR